MNARTILRSCWKRPIVPQWSPITGKTNATIGAFALASSGSEFGYTEKFGEVTCKGVLSYMVFDKTNPSSVRSCLEMARNNARSVRTGITAELWEAINTTWIEFSDVNPQSITQDRLPDFLSWISQRSHLVRGALLNTILRDDGYYFSQLGNFIERADNTARILNTQYWVLLPDNDVIGDGSAERYQWVIILRALSGSAQLSLCLSRYQAEGLQHHQFPDPAQGHAAIAGPLLQLDRRNR